MNNSNKMGKSQKWAALVLMMLAMSTIYILPYLRSSYYTALQEAMGLLSDSAAYGTLTSVYGIMNLIFYLPGGIIADKFDAKKLLVFSMVATGVLGLWLSTWPGYNTLLVIHILFGVTTVLTFWSSSVKVVNLLAASDEQGQMFGFLEGGRGVVGLLVTSATLGLFAYLANTAGNVAGITAVVVVVSVVMIVIGLALSILLPKTDNSTVTNQTLKDSLLAMGKCFRLPITWCLSAIIFTCCTMTTTGSYFAPYLEGACGLTTVMASTFAVLRTNAVPIIAAPIAGAVSKKQGRSTGVIIAAMTGLIVINAVLLGIPASPALLFPLIAVMLVYSFMYSSNRAVYWATVDETGTPKNMVGSVIGIASMIGFFPDTFLNTYFGSIIDNNSFSEAYKKIFLYGLIMSAVGLAFSIAAHRVVRRYQAEQSSKSSN